MKKVKIYDTNYMEPRPIQPDEVRGLIGDNPKWWFDENHPHSFELFDINFLYCNQYFAFDHVRGRHVKNYVNAVKTVYNSFARYQLGLNLDEETPKLNSVLEVGAGGGWFTEKFLQVGINVTAIEGTQSGVDAMRRKKIPESVIIHHDLRREVNLRKKFDIACCTEVAEHIEPPFSSQLIKTITDHSDLVLFSFEGPGPKTHYHHSNEQPEKFWINLFDFYGYGLVRASRKIKRACRRRGSHIFFNRKKYPTHLNNRVLF